MRLKAISIIFGAMLICLAIVFGWRGMNSLMFTHNPHFEIKEVEITTQLAVTPQKIRELTEIYEGKNIFSFHAGEKRESLLRNVPNLGEVKITKQLPDKVQIVATDRVPVIKIGVSNFASDPQGYVMVMDEALRRRWSALPVLTDGNDNIKALPGQTLSGKHAIALRIMNVYNEMEGISFKIEQIDVSGRIYIILMTADGNREIRLVWEELITDEDIRLALKMASESLAQPKAAPLIRLDVLLSTMSVYGI